MDADIRNDLVRHLERCVAEQQVAYQKKVEESKICEKSVALHRKYVEEYEAEYQKCCGELEKINEDIGRLKRAIDEIKGTC